MIKLIFFFSAVKIIKKPKDVTALENTPATFELSVSHDTVPVKWFFKNVELKSSEKHKTVSERKVHKLVFQNATSEDAGEYTAVVGQLECKAKLFVESKYILIMIFCHDFSNMLELLMLSVDTLPMLTFAAEILALYSIFK